MFLTGCPMGRDFPIDTPSIKVDKRMFGTYTDITGHLNSSGSATTFIVDKATEYEYSVHESYLQVDSLGNMVPKNMDYNLHLSKVKGKTFFNIRQKEDKRYLFYKAELRGNEIVVYEVVECFASDRILGIGTSADLKSFLGKYINNDLLFGEAITLKKQ